MGAVYKARQKSLDRLGALKIIKPDAVGDPGFAERFAREAKALARMNHSTIVSVHDLGESDGLFFFVMEYVDGTNLRRLLETSELAPEQAIQIIPQVCEALQFAHDEGIVHRDIKPENILVGPYGEVLLLDWGLAKVWHKDGSTSDDDNQESKPIADSDKTITGHGKLQGTLCYMSPEQIHRDPNISFSTDIYSLGSVLYELLTGTPPFDSDKVYEILDMVENQQAAKPSEISKFPIPKMLEALCLRCINKDPADRPASMEDVVRALQQDWTGELIPVKR